MDFASSILDGNVHLLWITALEATAVAFTTDEKRNYLV